MQLFYGVHCVLRSEVRWALFVFVVEAYDGADWVNADGFHAAPFRVW